MNGMSMTALQLSAAKAVRVAIVSTDSARRAELARKLDGSGHVIVVAASDADVILCDGDASLAAAASAAAVITLGAAESSQNSVLPANATAEQLDASIRAVAVGLIVRPARERTNGFGELRQGKVRSLLTPREVEMLSAIGSGLSNKAIARRLDISLHTVKFHIESLFRKLGARSRAEAVAKGLERRRSETVEL
jgi:DNA-binding NarL/FixJ family response regulator